MVTVLWLMPEGDDSYFPGHIHAFYLEYIYFNRVGTSLHHLLPLFRHSKIRELRSCPGKRKLISKSCVARPSSSRQHCAKARARRLLRECTEGGTNFLWHGAGLGTLAEGGVRKGTATADALREE